MTKKIDKDIKKMFKRVKYGAFKMSDEEYFASPAFNASFFKKIKGTDVHTAMFNRYVLGIGDKGTSAKAIGSIVHQMILEPEKASSYVVLPEYDKDGNKLSKNSKAYKQYCQELYGLDETPSNLEQIKEMASAKGFLVVSQDDKKVIDYCYEAVKDNPYLKALSKNSMNEIALFWECPDTGLPLKCKIDMLYPDLQLNLDVKTIQDISEVFIDNVCVSSTITKAIKNFSYHLSQAHYEQGMRQALGYDSPKTQFLFVEKAPPNKLALRTIHEDNIANADRKLLMLKKLIAKGIETGEYETNPYKFDYDYIKYDGTFMEEF